MKRIALFLLTNIAVLIVISIMVQVFGVNRWLTANGINYGQLLVFSTIVGFSGSFISLAISKWMAKMAYSIQVIERPQSEDERWLYETVQDLSNRAGIPMPEVGVYDSPEANAFATGPSKKNSLVAVSTGLLHSMNRGQVEGVLAHEVAHVANGDMVTMTLLQGVLNTFVVFLSRVAGFAIDRAISRDRESSGIGYFIATMICQVLLSILASLVVMAYSRHREFRADAGAANLSSKENMIGALERLNEIVHRGGVLDDRSKALSAFKISGKSGGFASWFASHPPLEDRIAALQKLA
jgi:heat shock protein HtpX